MEEPDKILVRSNGTVTYTGKDIAYQLWKFGLLAVDFDYQPLHAPVELGRGPRGGDPDDVRGTRSGGPRHPAAPRRPALRPRLARLQRHRRRASPTRRRSCGRASGRSGSPRRPGGRSTSPTRSSRSRRRPRGSWRSASARSTASRPRTRRSPSSRCPGARASASRPTTSSSCCSSVPRRDREPARADAGRRGGRRADARAIAIGALRYFLLKVGRNKVIAFDFDEALNFEGDTGPYLQYSLVRADNIFRKLEEKGLSVGPVGAGSASSEDWEDDLWQIALDAASTPDVAERAVESLELATLARHAFGLAQSFNHFYHRQPILQEPDRGRPEPEAARSRVFSGGRCSAPARHRNSPWRDRPKSSVAM